MSEAPRRSFSMPEIIVGDFVTLPTNEFLAMPLRRLYCRPS
jgi:hypothetical protein